MQIKHMSTRPCTPTTTGQIQWKKAPSQNCSMTAPMCRVNVPLIKNGKFICQTYGTGGGKFEDLYETALAAYAAQEVKDCEKAAKYCEQIKDVPSLLTFALNHCLCGEEYTDYSAIKAYKASAKRLLGVDL